MTEEDRVLNEEDIARLFYDQKVAAEKMVENPTGEFAALNEMFAEIQALGYDYHYLADIEMHTIRDTRVMRILYKYYPRMEFRSTRETFISRISPQKVPEVLEYAIAEYLALPDVYKLDNTSFENCISRAKKTPQYLDRIFGMLKRPEHYATMGSVRQALCRQFPGRMRPLLEHYRQGLLLCAVISDYAYFDDAETEAFLRRCLTATAADIAEMISDSSYTLCVTYEQEYKRLCTEKCIHDFAQRSLKKIEKRKKEDTLC